MSRERFKKTEFNYFDLDVLSDVDEEGEAFSSFLGRYGTFVVKRAEGYDAGFQELEKVDHEDGWEHAVTALEKAQQTIDLGLACKPGRREENEITVLCLRETAMDLRELWQRYRSALTGLLAEAEKATRFDGVDSAVLTECLGGFERSCKARYDAVTAFLLGAEEVIGSYGMEVPDLSLPPAPLPDPHKPSSAPASPAAAAEVDPPAEAASATNERTATDTVKRMAAKAKAYRESRSSATASTRRRTGTRTNSTRKRSIISGKESPTSTTGSSGSASTSSSSSVDRSTTASTAESDAKAGGTPITHAARSTVPTEGLQGGNGTRKGR